MKEASTIKPVSQQKATEQKEYTKADISPLAIAFTTPALMLVSLFVLKCGGAARWELSLSKHSLTPLLGA